MVPDPPVDAEETPVDLGSEMSSEGEPGDQDAALAAIEASLEQAVPTDAAEEGVPNLEGAPLETADIDDSSTIDAAPEAGLAAGPAPEEEAGDPATADEPQGAAEAEALEASANAAPGTAVTDAPSDAPGTAVADTAQAATVEAAGFAEDGRLSPWPFLAYDAIWVVFAGILAWQLLELPVGTAAYEAPLYQWSVYGGLALTAAGPVLALIVWLFARRHRTERAGLFTSTLVAGSAATFVGVIAWWIALIAVDYVRLGHLF